MPELVYSAEHEGARYPAVVVVNPSDGGAGAVATGPGTAAAAQRVVNATDDKSGTRTYGTTQRIAIGSASVQSTAIIAAEIMLHASSRCFIKTGADPTAVVDGDSIPLEAGEKFHMRITSGHEVAVIRDTEDGFLHVTPVV